MANPETYVFVQCIFSQFPRCSHYEPYFPYVSHSLWVIKKNRATPPHPHRCPGGVDPPWVFCSLFWEDLTKHMGGKKHKNYGITMENHHGKPSGKNPVGNI
jgi:hypothetical protein